MKNRFRGVAGMARSYNNNGMGRVYGIGRCDV